MALLEKFEAGWKIGRLSALNAATPSSFLRIHPSLLIEPQRSKEWLATGHFTAPWQRRHIEQPFLMTPTGRRSIPDPAEIRGSRPPGANLILAKHEED